MKSSVWALMRLVLRKELTVSRRFRAAWAAMGMFVLTALSAMSLALAGQALSPQLSAALLWILLFFASLAGADRVFGDEEAAGTLLSLRVYGAAQPVLWGKFFYTLFVLGALTSVFLPLFLMLLDVSVVRPLWLLAVTLLGVWGIAAGGTLTAALAAGASVKSGLFSVLLLPVILPVFLPAVSLTAAAFSGSGGGWGSLFGMALYDGLLSVGASVLFDYLWYEA